MVATSLDDVCGKVRGFFLSRFLEKICEEEEEKGEKERWGFGVLLGCSFFT